MNEQRKLGFASITLLFFGFIISDAYAYIDPGSGSYSKNKLKHTGKPCDCQYHIITEKVKN